MGSDVKNRWVSFAETSTGYSHIKAEAECEDSSGFYTDEDMHICVVADGHGSKQYFRTKMGSSFAVEVAITSIKSFVANTEKKKLFDRTDEYLKELARRILESWNDMVACDYSKNPFSEDELSDIPERYKNKYMDQANVSHAYGTTLIAFVVTKDYSFGLQLGDGKCVVLDTNGKYIQPIPWDDNCQLNVTTSICDKNALQEFRFYISDKLPIAAFCGTDGIDDSYTGDDELIAFYNGVLSIFAQYGYDTGVNEVKEYLPILTQKGSMDDVSVAGIIDMKRARNYLGHNEKMAVEDIVSNDDNDDNTVIMEPVSDETIIDTIENVAQSYGEDFGNETFDEVLENDNNSADISGHNDSVNTIIKNKALKNGISDRNLQYSKYFMGLLACVGVGVLIRLFKGNKR